MHGGLGPEAPTDLADRSGAALLQRGLTQRVAANEHFFAAESQRIAELCHRMAERFARGGRLIAFGCSPAARSDARHVAVEFVHPVIVGKRALPALALVGEGESVSAQAELLLAPADVTMSFGCGVEDASGVACGRGCLTIAFGEAPAQWQLDPPSADPFVRQELVETLYHVLWELVHVFFEHRGLLQGRGERALHDSGASSFLYPFLAEQEQDLPSVLADVARSAQMKASEVNELRAQTLVEGSEILLAAAATLRQSFAAGGKLLALGNGGSATDAMDAVADFRDPCDPRGGAARAAIDLTDDPAVITAIANDVGVEAIFARQVIAHGRERDALLAISTSGNSANVIEALAEARRRRIATVALVGYDGGRVASERLADHVIVTRSQHIPRIQEAQASACHLLCELVGLEDGARDRVARAEACER